MSSCIKAEKNDSKTTAQTSHPPSTINGYNPDLYGTHNGGYNPEYWHANGLAKSAWYPRRTTPNIRPAGGHPFPLKKRKRHQHDSRKPHERIHTTDLSALRKRETPVPVRCKRQTAPPPPPFPLSSPFTDPSIRHRRPLSYSAAPVTSSSTSIPPPPTAPASTNLRRRTAQPGVPTRVYTAPPCNKPAQTPSPHSQTTKSPTEPTPSPLKSFRRRSTRFGEY